MVELTEGSATTRTLVAEATGAADVTVSDGNIIAEVQLVYRTGQVAAADLLFPKYDCVDGTNQLPSRLVQQVARETFITTNALYRCSMKNESSLKPSQRNANRITETA